MEHLPAVTLLSLLVAACAPAPVSRPAAMARPSPPAAAIAPHITAATPARPATTSSPPGRPPWPRTLPPASVMGDGRGRWLRVVVHAHSVQSSDACDGRPYVDGAPNEPCLQSFRAALCATRVDAVLLTEHADRMAAVRFEDTMQMREGDEALREDGALVGYRIACPDGHRAMVLPGAENDLMPVGLARHPTPVDGSLARAYRLGGARGARLFREAGALVAVAHPESRSRARLRAAEPDLIELYNIHANVDPSIAGPTLGIDLGPIRADVLRFADPAAGLEPDCGFLAIFRENRPDLAHWAALAAEGRRVTAFAGSDAHENQLPQRYPDGERGDSYRRIFRWYANAVRVDGEPTRRAVLDALTRPDVWAVIEAWGTPRGFSFALDGRTLRVGAPEVHGLDPSLPRPAVRVRLLRADASGRWEEVAAGEGPLAYTAARGGAYRAEALITPHHARPYLPGLERLVREVPWVYSNALTVAP